MAGNGWNPTSMPTRETQISFLLPKMAAAPPVQPPEERPAEQDEEH